MTMGAIKRKVDHYRRTVHRICALAVTHRNVMSYMEAGDNWYPGYRDTENTFLFVQNN